MPKRNSFHVIALLAFVLVNSAAIVCSFTSCDHASFTTSSYEIKLAYLPYSNSDYKVVAKTFLADTSGNITPIDTFDLGSVNPDESVNTTISISNSSQYVGFYLLSSISNSVQYFYDLKLSDVSSKKLINISYWLSYAQYSNNVVEYGVSTNDVVDLGLGDSKIRTIDFTKTPFYCLHYSGIAGKSMNLILTGTHGGQFRIYTATDLISLMDRDKRTFRTCSSETYQGSTYIDTVPVNNWASSDLYILLMPDSYSACYTFSLEAVDSSLSVSLTFRPTAVLSLDQGKTLYFTTSHRDASYNFTYTLLTRQYNVIQFRIVWYS